jgi:beta-glucanase (GH16 family)
MKQHFILLFVLFFNTSYATDKHAVDTSVVPVNPYEVDPNAVPYIEGYHYVWGDEFNTDGSVNTDLWAFENGFKRGNEAQLYVPGDNNAIVKDGRLLITAKKERRKNPNYDPASPDYRKYTEYGEYTSASINGNGVKYFLYGRTEVRARIDFSRGAFPAVWTCGYNKSWPRNGEIDIMESYLINKETPVLTANFCVGGDQTTADGVWATKWNSTFTPVTYFTAKDAEWKNKYHVYRMDWDEEEIKLYVDNELRNSIKINEFRNWDGTVAFNNPQYMWLNLAIKDQGQGIEIDANKTILFEVDYFRVYQKVVDTEPPAAVSGLVASEITDASCKLTWNHSTDNHGVFRYDIYRNGMGSGAFVGSTTNNSFVVNGLKANTDHYFFVRTLDSVGNYSFYDRTKTFIENKALKVTTRREFDALSVPFDIHADIFLKTKTSDGKIITWESSNTAVLSNTGAVNLPDEKTEVILTVRVDGQSKQLIVNVHPRNVNNNKLIYYSFDVGDVYARDNVQYLRDKSGKDNDAIVYGHAKIDGKLDLRNNKSGDFANNGFLTAPDGLITALRSYTVTAKVNPTSLSGQPRLFDFGSGSLNSVFGRLNKLSSGQKYNKGATVLVSSGKDLMVSKEYFLAFTFDAKTGITKVYVDDEEVASAATFVNEPWQIGQIGNNSRNYIGRTQWWDTSSAVSNVDYCGLMDDFYLFDIALTNEELKYLKSMLTDIESSLKQNELKVFPNPVTQYADFFVQMPDDCNSIDNDTVEVFDIRGNLIKRFDINSNPALLKADFPKGIYFIRLSKTGSIYFMKLLVQ